MINKQLGTTLESLNWRQGSIISNHDLEFLLKKLDLNVSIDSDSIGIVISHSCNIANNHITQFSGIEILIARKITELDGNKTHNKNPRLLHTTIQHMSAESAEAEDYYFELNNFEKIHIEKTNFVDIQPDEIFNILVKDLNSLVDWLAAHYKRPTLPTSFNERLESVDRGGKGRKKIAKEISQDVRGLYIELFPNEELPKNKNYSANLLAVIAADFSGSKSDIKEQIEKFAKIMRKSGMDVKVAVAQTNEISIADIERFERFNFDDISKRNNDEYPPDI